MSVFRVAVPGGGFFDLTADYIEIDEGLLRFHMEVAEAESDAGMADILVHAFPAYRWYSVERVAETGGTDPPSLTAVRRQALAEALEAVAGEYLSDATGEASDLGYHQAVVHCCSAVRRLMDKLP